MKPSHLSPGNCEQSSLESLSELGRIFAKAFAVFTAELAEQCQKRGIPFELAARTPAADLPPALSDAPDWVKRAYAGVDRHGPTAVPDLQATRAKFVAQRIRLAMKDHSMNQATLAKKMGMAPSQLSRILKNPARSQLTTLTRIADHLGIDVGALLVDVATTPEIP